MRKNWKFMVLVLVAAMLLTACANTGKPVESTEPDDSAAPEATMDPAVMTPFAAYDEPVTLTFARIMNRGAQLAPDETTSDNCMIDIVKEKLNVNCEIAWETAPDQYDQRLALSIAGGNLPDVFLITRDNYMTFTALVENGALADLTDAYNNCIGGIAAEWIATYDGKPLVPATFDGKIMAIPAPVGGYNYNILWIRKDWLDQVNLPLPKTVDDIKAAALAFKDAKLGGDNTVGIVVDPVKPLGTSDSFLSVSTVANSQGAYPKSWIEGEDGNVVYGSITPEMKQTLAVLADWYEAGVLDPQWMTYQNMDAVTPAIRNGECGMYFGAWWSPWTVADSVVQHPEMDWVPVLAPLDEEGMYNHVNNAAPANFVVVNANCEHPEAVVKANNVLFELFNGAYDEEPGVKDAIEPSKQAGSFGRTICPFSGTYSAELFDRYVQTGIAITKYAQEGGELNMPDFATPEEINQAEKCRKFYLGEFEIGDEGFTEAYSLYNSYATESLISDPSINYDEPVLFSYTTPAMGDYLPALDTLEKEMIVQIISGEKPVDYFDEFVEQWKSSGGDIITAEVQAIVDAR